jgi:tetratricopeptide (TPR) repeat protein
MENEKFRESQQLGPINNFRQLRRGRKVFLGDNSDLRNCNTLNAATVERNWPSQWHSRFPDGYVLLSVNNDKKYFDLARQTVDGNPSYIFAATKGVEGIYFVKPAQKQKIVIQTSVLLNEGRRKYRSGNLWGAAQKYKEITELDPANGEARSRLGHTLLKLGLYKEATEALGRAESLPITGWQLSRVYDDLGLASAKLGNHGAAILLFDFSVGFWPKDVKALVHRGESLRKTGQYESSYTDALMALKLRPDYAPALRLKRELEART